MLCGSQCSYENQFIRPEPSDGHTSRRIADISHDPSARYPRTRRDSAAKLPTSAIDRQRQRQLANEENLSHLPVNRTILFNCDNPNVECARVRFAVPHFRSGDRSAPIRIQLNMIIDLAVIGMCSETRPPLGQLVGQR